MKLAKHTKKSNKPSDIIDSEIKKDSQANEYLQSHTWYSIGNILHTTDDLSLEFDIIASYNTGKYAIVQYINDVQNCVWKANTIEDLNSAMYHHACLSYYVIED
jgi:hypothetical protein